MDFINEMKELKFTHQEIAGLAGLTRETTTRVLNRMEKEGVITVKNRNILIKDRERLKDLCV